MKYFLCVTIHKLLAELWAIEKVEIWHEYFFFVATVLHQIFSKKSVFRVDLNYC